MTLFRYDRLSRLLHWLVAGLIVLVFAGALVQEELPRGSGRALVLSLHVFGRALILALVLVRLSWASRRKAPDGQPGLMGIAARIGHVSLYLLMLATPLAGWWLYSVRGRPSELLGFSFPAFVAKNDAVRGFAGEAHEVLAWLLIALAALHVAAALYHQFVLRDGLMRRMGIGSDAA